MLIYKTFICFIFLNNLPLCANNIWAEKNEMQSQFLLQNVMAEIPALKCKEEIYI